MVGPREPLTSVDPRPSQGPAGSQPSLTGSTVTAPPAVAPAQAAQKATSPRKRASQRPTADAAPSLRPDQRPTVKGRVLVAGSEAPPAGATVMCSGDAAAVEPGGHFSALLTSRGRVVCEARAPGFVPSSRAVSAVRGTTFVPTLWLVPEDSLATTIGPA